MGATLTRPEAPLAIAAARRRLADTSRLSPEQVGELEKVVAAFHSARPTNRACVACGSMIWSEHATADGDACWGCAGCHRPATLTAEAWRAEAWRAQVAAKREAEALRAATATADACSGRA
jgi:hypothetical protein